MGKCKNCGKEFKYRKNKDYCSNACKQAAFKRNRKMVKTPRNCYMAPVGDEWIFIKSPEGTDIMKLIPRNIVMQGFAASLAYAEQHSSFTIKRVKL